MHGKWKYIFSFYGVVDLLSFIPLKLKIVIVEDILRKEKHEEEKISALVERWKVNGMYLADLSCCGDECIC